MSQLPDAPLFVVRKACTLSLNSSPDAVEWGTWVDTCSPHVKQVWKSQFPSLLLKCMRYFLTTNDFLMNDRSVMWGLGAKAYPPRWWHPTWWWLFHKYGFHRIVNFQELLS